MRLLFIATSAISLAGPALTLALSTIQLTTLDTALYQSVYGQYLQLCTSISSGDITDAAAVEWYEGVKRTEGKMAAAMDVAWIARTKSEAGKTIDKLEVELKGYTTNLIKESIRVSRVVERERESAADEGRRWDTGIWRGVCIGRGISRVLLGRTRRDESTALLVRTFSKCVWESSR